MKKSILISVIIPVYNIEKHLRNALDSLLTPNKEIDDIEIILIDDGSTDSSSNICDEYKEKYDCIRVKHMNNHGVSHARNAGLDISNGEWIAWIDGDDMVYPGYIDIIKKLVKKSKYDIFKFDYSIVNFNETAELESKKYNNTLLISEEKNKAMFDLPSERYGNYLWCRLFKKSLFNGLRFPENNDCEDAYLLVDVLNRANEFAYYKENLYVHFNRLNSITKNPNKEKAMLQMKDWFLSNIRLTEKLDEYGFKLAYQKSESGILDIAFMICQRIDYLGYPDVDIYDKAQKVLNSYRKYSNTTTLTRKKVLFFIRLHCKYIFKILCKIKYRKKKK